MTLQANEPALFTDSDSDGWGAVQVTIVRQLSDDEADEEVGPMFEVRRANGATKSAFADELSA